MSRFHPFPAGLTLVAMALLPATALAQAWPSRPVTLVVGSGPGGSNDVFARAIARGLQTALGQPIVVENKPSAGGVTANAAVARAAPDGYTLVVVSSTFTTGAAIRTSLPYDAQKDLAPVAMLAKGPMLLTVRKDSPLKTLPDLVAAAKAAPGKLNYGTSGAGSINHFATEVFDEAAGIRMTHIPYKGMAPATTDLLGGQIDVLVASAPSILAQVKSGNARALAVTSEARSPVAPDVPAVGEAGFRGAATDLWWGVLAPAKTPAAIVDRLNAELSRLVLSVEMREFFLQEGAIPAPMKPTAFAAFIGQEIVRWRTVARRAGIEPE